MKYRLYVTGSNGYYDLGVYTKIETIKCLDWLILKEQTKEKF